MTAAAAAVTAAAAAATAAAVATAVAALPPGGLAQAHVAPPSAAAPAAPQQCLTAAVRSRLDGISQEAHYRYTQERSGAAVRRGLRGVEHDTALVSDVAEGKLAAALDAADKLLVEHVVRIQITRGATVLVDANPTSFAVAGDTAELLGPSHQALGELDVTVQDVGGFIRLVHEFSGGDIVVRGAGGRVEAWPPALSAAASPTLGCVTVAGHTYAAETFPEPGFAGARLSVEVLTPA